MPLAQVAHRLAVEAHAVLVRAPADAPSVQGAQEGAALVADASVQVGQHRAAPTAVGIKEPCGFCTYRKAPSSVPLGRDLPVERRPARLKA